MERGLQFQTERMDKLMSTILPALANHVTMVAESLTKSHLEQAVHRRKCNLVLHGVDGPAGEDSADTRQACIDFAKESLKVPQPEADNTRFSAGHRLIEQQAKH